MCAKRIDSIPKPRRAGDLNGLSGVAQPVLQSLLDGIGDIAFAIDTAGLILGWNRAASQFISQGHRGSQGLPCAEVFHCHSREGETLRAGSCPLLRSIRTHEPTTSQTIQILHESGTILDAHETAIPLPPGLGSGALVVLSPSGRGGDPDGLAPSPRIDRAGDVVSPDPLSLGLDTLLDRLLATTGADAAEVFLATASAGPLLLAAYRGQTPRAFHQRIAFDLGEGFPGLVVQTAQPLLSTDLAHDERYLRTEVVRHGFRSYVCVPVWGKQGIVGSLQIASRNPGGALGGGRIDQIQTYLAEVAAELGAALELACREASDSVGKSAFSPRETSGSTLRQYVQQAIQSLGELAQADEGALFVIDERSDRLQPLGVTGLSSRARGVIARKCCRTTCPALSQQRCVLPAREGGTDRLPCPLHRGELAPALCVPLVADGASLGVAVLRNRHRASPPRARIPLLLAPAARIAEVLAQARRTWHPEAPAPVGPIGADPPMAAEPEAANSAAHGNGRFLARLRTIPVLDLHCFGTFTLYRDGVPVTPNQFARRRSLTILKILLTRYGKSIHRDELQEILWPELDSAAARPLLNVAIHYLRRGLEPDLPEGAASAFIQATENTYSFDTRAPHHLDTEIFRSALHAASQSDEHGDIWATINALEPAIAIYTGDFLEEELYSDWCALERTYLRERYLNALRQLARLYLHVDHLEESIECLRRALHTEPTLEDAHRLLMRALWQAGRRDEAVRQYQECRATLAQVLGITPDPATERLYGQISQCDRPQRSPRQAS